MPPKRKARSGSDAIDVAETSPRKSPRKSKAAVEADTEVDCPRSISLEPDDEAEPDLSSGSHPILALDSESRQTCFPACQRNILSVLSGDLPLDPGHRITSADGKEKDAPGCVGLEEEQQTLHSILASTVTRGEGNSCLLIGARGAGKSMLLNSVLRSVRQGSAPSAPIDMKRASGSALKASSTSSGFYHVHLDGALQPNDRLAMRELASQLVSQGAFGAGEVEVEDADPVENQERAEEQLEVDDDDDDEHANALNDDDEEYDGIDTAAIFASLATTTAHIISLLSNPSELSNARKPLVISLDAFDLFTQRPRQALLYCLLDAVQAGSYPAGLAVIGLTSRLDTTDLLEKRVKSRFSHRIVHVRPPKTYENFERIARQALLPRVASARQDSSGSGTDKDASGSAFPVKYVEQFEEQWRAEVDGLFATKPFQDVLHGIHELSNDVRMLYRILVGPIASLTPERPTLEPLEFIRAAAEQRDDFLLSSVHELGEPEFALLIAAKHLQTRDRAIFNFEMCFDELRRFDARETREREGVGAGAEGALMQPGPDQTGAGASPAGRRIGGSSASGAGKGPRMADRRMAMMAFETLLSLELFLPESSLASITGGGARSGTGAGASLGMGGSTGPTSGPGSGYGATWSTSMRKEFIRVRCALDPPQIVQAAKDKGRRAGSGAGAGAGAGTETLPTSLVKWAGSFG